VSGLDEIRERDKINACGPCDVTYLLAIVDELAALRARVADVDAERVACIKIVAENVAELELARQARSVEGLHASAGRLMCAIDMLTKVQTEITARAALKRLEEK